MRLTFIGIFGGVSIPGGFRPGGGLDPETNKQ